MPAVGVSFLLTYLAVPLGVDWLSDTLARLPTSTTSPPSDPVSPLVDPGTTHLLALLAAAGVAWSVARAAWGRRATTEAWRIGAEGEERTARELRRLERHGYRVLHDVRIPGSRANIDHIVVGPTGVLTIETKSYKGKVRITRPLFARGTVARHNGRNLDTVVDQALGQAEVVEAALLRAFPEHELMVWPVVAFHRARIERGWFVRPVTSGVRWCSAPRLVRVIKASPSSLRGPQIAEIADALEGGLAPHRPTPSQPGAARPPSAPTCQCGAQMVLRRRRADGAGFYGCSTFPACRNTRPA